MRLEDRNTHSIFRIQVSRGTGTAALRRLGFAMLMSYALSGCAALSLLGSEAPPQTYELRAMPEGNFSGKAGSQLSIREPHAIQVLDNERIVFRPTPQLVNYYAGAQWADRLPKLVEERLVASFERVSNLRTVSRTTDGLTVDYQLLTEIRDFSIASTTESSFAEVRIQVKLVADAQGRATSGQLFEARVPVAGSGVPGAVEALDAALGEVLTKVVDWTVRRI